MLKLPAVQLTVPKKSTNSSKVSVAAAPVSLYTIAPNALNVAVVHPFTMLVKVMACLLFVVSIASNVYGWAMPPAV